MTNSEKNKDLLSNDELAKNSKKSDDYSNLLEKIRKQVDIENSSTYTRKTHNERENLEETVIMPTVTEEVTDEYAETVVLDKNELVQAIKKEEALVGKKVEKVEGKPVVLEVLGLKKRIGLKTIVEDITFDMREGEIIARVCGKKVTRARMKELVEFVGLSKVIRKKVKTYSLGMRQRLGLAQALLNDPKVLILDEPVNGLDPQGVQDFRNKLKEIAATGVSILISSHLLDEIEKVSDRVIVIEKGKIIADDKLENLVADEVIKTLISTHDVEKTERLVRELGVRYELSKDGFVFENLSREEKSRIITYLVTNNVELETIRELTTSLEDRFLQITGGERK